MTRKAAEPPSDGSEPPPVTAAIPVRLRDRFDPRPGLERLRRSAFAIAQIVVAVAAAFAFCFFVLGHDAPLLAATVTITSLGLSHDARPRRVVETVAGMVFGILVAEAFVLTTGSGWWQLTVTLAVTLAVARLLSPHPGFAIAATIQSAIVLILPGTPDAPFTRLVDGLIGGAAALVVTALIPRNPRSEALRDVRKLFAAMDDTVATLAQALRRGSRKRAARGLEKARALDPLVREWRETLVASLAIARISPWLRRRRHDLARDERIQAAVDLAARNLRVVARRVVALCNDGTPRPVLAELLVSLGSGIELLGRSLDDASLEAATRDAVRAVAERLHPHEVVPDGSVGDENLVTMLRPLAVDLLVAAGEPREAAERVVPRI